MIYNKSIQNVYIDKHKTKKYKILIFHNRYSYNYVNILKIYKI